MDETVQAMHSKGYTNVAGCACHVGSAEQRKAYINNAVQVRMSILTHTHTHTRTHT